MNPHRVGLDTGSLHRRVAPLEKARTTALRRSTDPTDSGGVAVIWYRLPGQIESAKLAIQPGIADDPPSLLTALAGEIAWPDAPAAEGSFPAAAAIAVWARVWQVRERADLRVLLWWEADGAFHGEAGLAPIDGETRPLMDTAELAARLDAVARAPARSASPHALLLEGNAALRDDDFATAREIYARVLRDLPRHVEAHRNLALALAHLNEWVAAAEAMRAAVTLAPADPILGEEYVALETDAGIRAVREDDLARAANHFLHVLAIWPEEPTALANLGNLRLREDRKKEARAIFQRFLKRHPKHPAAAQIRQALRAIGE